MFVHQIPHCVLYKFSWRDLALVSFVQITITQKQAFEYMKIKLVFIIWSDVWKTGTSKVVEKKVARFLME